MDENTLGENPDPAQKKSDLITLLEGIDWNEVWRYRMTRWFSTLNDDVGDPFRHQREMQRSLPVSIRRKAIERVRGRIEGAGIRPGNRVLVVGGDPALFAVPLAKMDCMVTAVDPSHSFATVMGESPLDQESLPVEIINKRWDEVSPGELQEKYDIVVASYALWTTDIRAAIEKMGAVAGSVCLFWYLTPPVWAQVMGEIWKKVHGMEFRFAPTAECLFQVLLQKEIFASISVEEVGSTQFYTNIGEALETFRNCTQFTNVCQDNVVRNFLRSRLTLADNGFTLRGRSYDAKIWWKSRDQT